MSKGSTDNQKTLKCNKNNCEPAMPKSKSCADMSMKEFLDFFHTAYQLNQTVEGPGSDAILNQKLTEIDWNQLVQSPLVRKQDASENENSSHNGWASVTEQGVARRKLHQVLQEGLLDSVLPYLVPKHCSSSASSSGTTASIKRGQVQGENKMWSNASQVPSQERSTRRKQSQLQHSDKNKPNKPDAEVEIHVCDEVKGLKRTFRCPQRLLVSEMGYFAEVTAGQRLEDMDISVHCDVTNFEWLMQWVKRDQNLKEGWPKLDCSNVVAVLTSAAFLQMDLLLETCLHFCYTKANEVLAGPANLACLNDSVLTRLAGMFSNSEVEQLRDRKDRLQGRLYCKLIASLSEPEPEDHRGHFASLGRMFHCSECSTLVPCRSLSPCIPCTSSATRLGRKGDVRHIHTRSTSWNLSEHVAELKAELRSWRRVYWHLWGEAHWIMCSRCDLPFPLGQAGWCRFHPEPPQFLGPPPQRSCGRHSCCGQRVLRFSPLSNQSGCQYENHIPELSTEKEKAVWSIFEEHKALIMIPPPAVSAHQDSLQRTVGNQSNLDSNIVDDETFLWPGLHLGPAPSTPSLLPANIWEPTATAVKRERINDGIQSAMGRAFHRSSNLLTADGIALETSESSSSESVGSGEEGEEEEEDSQICQPVRVTARPRTALQIIATSAASVARSGAGRHWDPALTTRCNQDDQREYEERAVRRLIVWLSRRTASSHLTHSRHSTHSVPQGGIFVTLEREWRDTHLRTDRSSNTGGRHRMRSSRQNCA